METIKLQEGVVLKLIPTDQFKTNLISVYFKRPICREEVTMNSLLPYVMRSGTKSYPDETSIAKKLQDLYGAFLGANVSKKGEIQIFGFQLAFINEKYVEEDLFKEVLSLLKEVLFEPYLEDGYFSDLVLSIEKEVLREAILARINDKSSYARERLLEEMCSDELYGVAEEGYIEDLDEIDPKRLYKHYKEMIRTSQIEIHLQGEMDREKVLSLLKKEFVFPRGERVEISVPDLSFSPSKVKEVTEEMDIEQAKLVLGYRTHRSLMTEDCTDLLLYASVLGFDSHSKLFRIVREKHSLCYYIGAGLESLKGLMLIQTGIEAANKDKVIELIEALQGEMREGNISQKELSEAKKMLINDLKSVKDNVFSLATFHFAQSFRFENRTFEQMIEAIEKVGIEDIQRVARSVELDSIFFLKGREK
ncbi:MAG: pitrilysin family protein [Filifactor alocis]|nr:pitrilysin family protein [Filifactor alocis]